MKSTFADDLKQSVTVVVLGCFIVGGLGTVKAPSAAGRDRTATVSVNRTNKGDRLPSASAPVYSTISLSNEKSPVPPKRPPLGCDPVFSPIANPAQAHIYRHCTA
jgi:hypothetical protein